jgi:ATP adenylyltransferase
VVVPSCPERVENNAVFSLSIVQNAMRRALADGALQPIETQSMLLDSDGVRFVLRTVSSLACKDKARHVAAAKDPLGDYDCSLFVGDLAPSHYVLLNKFQLLAGHVLLVTRRFERQERLLTVDDFAALITCLSEVDGLGFYNGGVEAGASQRHKHLQLVPLPLTRESPDVAQFLAAVDGNRDIPRPTRAIDVRFAPTRSAPNAATGSAAERVSRA